MMFPFFARFHFSALIAGVSLLLAGCANMSGLGGSSEYGCKAPIGLRCNSVSGNYYNAIQNNLPSQRQGRQANAASSAATSGPRSVTATHSLVANSLPMLTASPLRSQTRVLRLWFKPWEDADHDLVDQGFVYVQIENGHWLIDHVQQRIRDAYAPIRPPRSTALPATVTAKPTDPNSVGAGMPENSSAPLAAPSKSLPGTSELPADDSQ